MKTAKEILDKNFDWLGGSTTEDIIKAMEEYASQFKQTEQPQKLLPFNLERALAGDEVVTRDGRKVSEIHYFKTRKDKNKVAAVIDGNVYTYDDNGNYGTELQAKNDLFMASKQVTKWVNVYDDNGNDCFKTGQVLFETEEKAKSIGVGSAYYIATVPITFSI